MKGHLIVTVDPKATAAAVECAQELIKAKVGPDIDVTVISATGAILIPYTNQGV